MALVRVARFLDLTEAEVAASALRSGGLFVFIQNQITGRWMLNWVYAMGGFVLWVPEADAADARAFIAESRRKPSTLAPLPAAEAAVRTAISLLITLLFGQVIRFRPRRPERLGGGEPAD